MEILAHRGLWLEPSEQNSFVAFDRALAGGYGIETDLRDLDGAIVISHDMPRRGAIGFDDFLERYANRPGRSTFALNIKADGLCNQLQSKLLRFATTSYFVFDMSIPDTLSYLRTEMPVFIRRSEFERGSKLDEQAAGFWLDAFDGRYADGSELEKLLAKGRRVAVVSPELHGRPHLEAWHGWKESLDRLGDTAQDRMLLCTDFPAEARRFFHAS
jgi:glycerophosphoryl diester phosphodiesterase